MGRFIDNYRQTMFSTGKSKIGTFTHDISATGTQAITGVGFKPSKVTFIAAVSEAIPMSVGIDNGTLHYCMFNEYPYGAGKWGWANWASICAYPVIYVDSYASITSMNEDGFTLTWGKDGSPTGTVSVAYMAEM